MLQLIIFLATLGLCVALYAVGFGIQLIGTVAIGGCIVALLEGST